MRPFSALHPITAGFYFLSVLLLTMFSTHPAVLLLALSGGILFFATAHRTTTREWVFYVLLFLVISLTNPLFSHNGATILFFLNRNPITLEAVLYGVDIAAMLIAVIYWFKCFNLILTSDKLLFLLGKLSPKIALLLSSALRFIPMLRTQATKIRQAQTAMGLFAGEDWLSKLRGNVRVFSSLITWALEQAVDTGSAMKGRGYGLKGRSHYSLFRFRRWDGLLIVLMGLLDGVILTVMAMGKLDFSFYPVLTAPPFDLYTLAGLTAFGLLSFLPVILEVKEGVTWKYYRSKI